MARLKDDALWKAFSEFIRLRDSDQNGYCKCFTCGAIRYWRNVDAGHGIGRQHWGTRYDEINVKGQCKICNGFEGGRQDVFSKEIDRIHGKGTWDLLLLKSRQVTKWTSFEITHLTTHYLREAEKLRQSKTLRE